MGRSPCDEMLAVGSSSTQATAHDVVQRLCLGRSWKRNSTIDCSANLRQSTMLLRSNRVLPRLCSLFLYFLIAVLELSRFVLVVVVVRRSRTNCFKDHQ